MSISQTKKSCILGRSALVGATLIWGTSFVILKNTINEVPTLYVLAYRFLGSALLMLLIGVKDLKKIDREYVKAGVILGVLLYVAYTLQTFGLYYTTPSKNAFLTTTYCILTPFICWATDKKRPNNYNFLAAAVCIVGVGFVSLQNDHGVNIGDMLTLCCGLFFGMQIVATSKYVQGKSIRALIMIEFATAGVLSFVSALFTAPVPTEISTESLWSIVYLCVMCTAACFVLQTYGQKHTPAPTASVIMTLEAVFGAIFSALFFHEVLTPKLLLGFALIFSAVIITETKLSFLRRKEPKRK